MQINVSLGIIATALLAASLPAAAATKPRTMTTTAAGACQSALPAFEGLVRKRPLAVANEGDATAFVTCGFHGPHLRHTTNATMHFENTGSSDATVSCTLVDRLTGQTPSYMAKSVNVPAGSGAALVWNPANNSGRQFANLAASCALPPATGVRTLLTGYSVDIGE